MNLPTSGILVVFCAALFLVACIFGSLLIGSAIEQEHGATWGAVAYFVSWLPFAWVYLGLVVRDFLRCNKACESNEEGGNSAPEKDS